VSEAEFEEGEGIESEEVKEKYDLEDV